MSDFTIYQALRSGGLSDAGACAMMGNMYCESGMKSNNVEDRCALGDFDYTYAVDSGTISRYQWKVDAFGYGLCQWTYPSRKSDLYDYAKSQNVSIGSEKMQCDFCIYELQRDYANLYQKLCKTDDVPEAAKLICAEYERPAVNNFAARINAAQKYYNQFADAVVEEQPAPVTPTTPMPSTCEVSVRVVKQGDLGRDVFLLQCGLTDMGINCGLPDGDFGLNTKEAVCELQRKYNLTPNGIADKAVWGIILNVR